MYLWETFFSFSLSILLGQFYSFRDRLILQGNDQIRFELTYYALYPGVTVSTLSCYAVIKLQKSVK